MGASSSIIKTVVLLMPEFRYGLPNSKVENFGSRNKRKPENFPTTYEQEEFRKKKRIFVLLTFILSDIDDDYQGYKTSSGTLCTA
jgi:hypothetical protein